MNAELQTKQQLVDELNALRQRVAELEARVARHQQIEQALQESETRFRSVVEQSHDGISLTDEQGLVIEWNQAMEQITGLPAREIVGRPMWDVQFQMMPAAQKKPELYQQLQVSILAALNSGQAPWLGRLLEREYSVDGNRSLHTLS
jgi:PAS domain-containing protein